MATWKVVEAAAEEQEREEGPSQFIENALALPLAPQYRALLEGLRFDYMTMRDPNLANSGSGNANDYIHHYKTTAA